MIETECIYFYLVALLLPLPLTSQHHEAKDKLRRPIILELLEKEKEIAELRAELVSSELQMAELMQQRDSKCKKMYKICKKMQEMCT